MRTKIPYTPLKLEWILSLLVAQCETFSSVLGSYSFVKELEEFSK